MAYYNQQVTGIWYQLPYFVHDREYANPPVFLFMEPRPATTYRHDALRDFFAGWSLRDHYLPQKRCGA